MEQYQNFEVEDFLTDDFFVNSVLNPESKTSVFWNEWSTKYPHRKQVMEMAWAIASSITVEATGEELTDYELIAAQNNIKRIASNNNKKSFVSNTLLKSVWFKIAAAILLVLSFTLLYNHSLFYPNPTDNSANNLTSTVNRSNKSMVVLMPDGSVAILKPGSIIKFERKFATSFRSVYLEGEAFFEVRKNPLKPFLVHSQNMVTKVLGTSFSVSSYPRENEFKVTVTTGKVLVYNSEASSVKSIQRVTLLPNQMATFKRDVHTFQKDSLNKPLPLSGEIAKKEFSFNEVPVNVVLGKIEAAYGIKIVYDEAKFAHLSLNSPLSELPLDQKINVICQSINAKYLLKNGQFNIETN